MKYKSRFISLTLLALVLNASTIARGAMPATAGTAVVRIGDVMTVEGIRDNPLMGYGIAVGLKGTGDGQQTVFTMQTLANVLRKMGVQVSGTAILTRNVASVFVTATLPPFATAGTRIDVNVASTGDAKSLEGGMLLLTPLYGPDGQVYAVAQGPLVLGGYTGGAQANGVQVNHPTSGRIPEGGIIERNLAMDLSQLKKLSLLLGQSDFGTAENAAGAINKALGSQVAAAIDSRRVEVNVGGRNVPELLAQVQSLTITITQPARVAVNERTGTVVMGGNVTLGACSVMHGSLTIAITTQYQVSQPSPLSKTGQTVVVPQTTVQASEQPARRLELKEGTTVEDLVSGLQGIGATARDIVAILEAIRAAGALNAELVTI
ncbi:MAG TPA: flagellar basal body P-ring protein FlgI [Terriglobia bacterium]|nr:flagellar basal body P-ring protein FlgI [Terriglobia bacterium]